MEDYKELAKIYHMDNSSSRDANIKKELESRLNAESTFRTNFRTPNGELFLDSCYIFSEPYGVEMRFSNDPVRIIGSNLMLENFELLIPETKISPLQLQKLQGRKVQRVRTKKD